MRSTPTATFGDLALAQAGRNGTSPPLPVLEVVLDVRTNNEFRASHVEGAVHVPLYELKSRIDEIPQGTVWVHCGSGYRATAAASLLEHADRRVVVIDDLFGAARDAGVSLASES